MDKAERYQQLLIEYDKLAWKVSQLKSTGGGINLSNEILEEIKVLEGKQVQVEQEAMFLQQGL